MKKEENILEKAMNPKVIKKAIQGANEDQRKLMENSWENQYPLSTFTGETKRELVNFIRNLLNTD